MDAFQVTLVVATFLCTLVAGFVFAFAVVIMPGIRSLSDGDFLRAFQVMDGVIQRNQPAFVIVWAGSVVTLIAAAALGFSQLDDTGRVLTIAAVIVYLLGVQVPTALINIPLNNELKSLTIADLDDDARASARRKFEGRWNASNTLRTVLACVVSVLLLILLLVL